MLKINKDEVYVINQPKHITNYVLIVNNRFPLFDDVHEKLEKLSKSYDLLLVFSPEHFSEQKELDYDKFASLYEACSWIVSGGDLGVTVLKLLKYGREIFRHRTSLISNINDIGVLEEDKLERLVMSPIVKPVMSINRLSANDMYDIYSREELPWYKKLGQKESDRVDRYCSYVVTSNVMFFRDTTIDIIIDFFENIDPEFVRTFTNIDRNYIETVDIRYLFGSMMKRLCLDYLDMDYNEVQI